jgi:hypothetical protein
MELGSLERGSGPLGVILGWNCVCCDWTVFLPLTMMIHNLLSILEKRPHDAMYTITSR